jgi:Tol biopolymer transport system component
MTEAVSARAASIGRNGRIAFSSYRNGQLDIFSMRPDGTYLRNLTNDGAPDFQPSWSPDGSLIAFVSLHVDVSHFDQIFVMDLVSRGPTRLTRFEGGNPQEPAWSPDGDRIAFHVVYGGALDSEIFVMNTDGSGLRQITDNADEDSNPAWSPTGRRIAFVRNARVETMRPDGTHVRAVTPESILAFDPAWSPDCRHLVFVGREPAANQEDLFTIRSDGHDLQNLRKTLLIESSPDWSPDGRLIAYVLTKIHMESDEEDDWIYTIRSDGTNARNLTADKRTRDSSPDWRSIP